MEMERISFRALDFGFDPRLPRGASITAREPSWPAELIIDGLDGRPHKRVFPDRRRATHWLRRHGYRIRWILPDGTVSII